MKTILFQGDSITDCCRSRDNDSFLAHKLGTGYPFLVAGTLDADEPGQYDFYNRGVSGNRIVDVYARIKMDILNLKPDYMSILIGINDVWHEIDQKNGVDAPKFERMYGMLVEEIKEALPDIRMMVLEPFVLPGAATVSTAQQPHRYETFRRQTELRAAAAKSVAQRYGLTFVPLMKLFDEAAERNAPDRLLADGVHPNPAGHELIKREWLRAFRTLN